MTQVQNGETSDKLPAVSAPIFEITGPAASTCVHAKAVGTRNLQLLMPVAGRTGISEVPLGKLSSPWVSMGRMIAPHSSSAPVPTTRTVTKAVVPAAGLGTRFLPATKATPKEMLPVVDKPAIQYVVCLLYTSPSPRDRTRSRMPSSA